MANNSNINVFITIDTEEDSWGDFHTMGNQVENIMGVPKLQKLFNQYEAIPTYLVNWAVVKNKKAVTILSKIMDKGECEIGMHCHPWHTPPYREFISAQNSMLCNLPYDLIFDKLGNLNEEIIKNFNVKPVCFRAGRWGFSSKVAKAIKKLGYKIDSSVTPFTNWQKEGGPDFRNAPTDIYYFNHDKVAKINHNGQMLEIPPTIGFLKGRFEFCKSVRERILKGRLSKFHLVGLLDIMKLVNLRWLSPELSSGTEMIRLSNNFIRNGHAFLNMSFHSTSLFPGKSPFVKNSKELDQFLKRIEKFLRYASQRFMSFKPLSSGMDILP